MVVHNTCHACGLKVYANFSFQARVVLLLEALVFAISAGLEAVGFAFSSKLGFQVEVTLLEDHRLPIGTARQCPQGCGPLPT